MEMVYFIVSRGFVVEGPPRFYTFSITHYKTYFYHRFCKSGEFTFSKNKLIVKREEVNVENFEDRYLSPKQIIENRLRFSIQPNWKIVVMCFRESSGCEDLLNIFHTKPIKGYKIFYGIDVRETETQVFEAEVSGLKIGFVIGLSWGGPQAAIILEELAYYGVEYVIGFGLVGSIHPDIHRGDLVVASASIATDGTSRNYTNDGGILNGNHILLEYMKQEAVKLDYDLKNVIVANVDALYRETKALIASFSSLGCHVINLETSALYAASEACQVKSIWFGFVSDLLIHCDWDSWYMDTAEMSQKTSLLCKRVIERLVDDGSGEPTRPDGHQHE